MNKTKKIPKRKNVSQIIKNGTTIKTRDEFFQDNNNYIKPKYEGAKTLYREVTVVDSNRNNELAVIKFQSSGKFSVKNKVNQVEKYAPYIKTKDNDGKPIKLGEKFQRANPKYDIPKNKANRMKKNSVQNKNNKISNENRLILKELKGRKK